MSVSFDQLGDVRTERLDHHGIVAGVCDELRLVELVNHLLPSQRHVSHGQAIKAMVINATGFVGRALYLVPEFFAGKPVDRLIGPGIEAADLNDDALGRTLDEIFEFGVTELYALIASAAIEVFALSTEACHLDSSSFSLEGDYDYESDDPRVIEITHGYSKDKRPDLKQFVLELVCCEASQIPLWIEVLSGNSSDKANFAKTCRRFIDNLRTSKPTYLIADSALYSRDNMAKLLDTWWITRVPGTLSDVKVICEETKAADFLPLPDHPGYQYVEFEHQGVSNERWLLVHSDKAHQRELKSFDKKLGREHELAAKRLRKLCSKKFNCEADARAAVQDQADKLKYHIVEYELNEKAYYKGRGRPKRGQQPDGTTWSIKAAQVVVAEDWVEEEKAKMGRFVLATNHHDRDALPPSKWLALYKSQTVSAERGFRFLKDPRFFADGMYLKKPERVMAMVMIMSLSLLVYALAERKLRCALSENDETIPDQKGKATDRPTMRRVFQIFEGVDILIIKIADHWVRKVTNLNMLRQQILRLLGPDIEKYYASG